MQVQAQVQVQLPPPPRPRPSAPAPHLISARHASDWHLNQGADCPGALSLKGRPNIVSTAISASAVTLLSRPSA